MEKIIIRPMVVQDLAQILAIHLASFPGFFLTFLGPDFLRLFYRNIFAAPQGVVLVAASNAMIVRFAAGVTQQSGFYQRLIMKHIRLHCKKPFFTNQTSG